MKKKPPQPLHPTAIEKTQEGGDHAIFSDLMVTEICAVFDHLDGVCFFLKDKAGRFIHAGDGPRQALFQEGCATCGLTDHDLYPQGIADRIRRDDELVMQTNRPMLNIVEILTNPHRHSIGWYVTNKFPAHDAAGAVIGIMGTVQPFEVRRKILLTGTTLDDVLEHVNQHYAETITQGELAAIAGLSERGFRRRFSEVLGVAPQDFVLQTRLLKACDRLIHSEASVSEIAVAHGFCDQSAFSVQFRRVLGITPLQYRKRFTDALAARHRPENRKAG